MRAAEESAIAGGTTVEIPVKAEWGAGAYALDSAHGKITWKVDHLGFSTYIGQFVNVQAELNIDPANPSAGTLTATIPLTDVASNSDGLDRHLQTADFFDTANHPTATFVSRSVTVDADDANEATVVGFYRGLQEVGLKPGKDIAVVGYNDIPLANELIVPLTSVRLPLAEMGRHAVELLLKRIKGEAVESIILAPQLQVRASSGLRVAG